MGLGQAFHYMLMLEARGLLSSEDQSSQVYLEMRERCRLAWVDVMGTLTISRSQLEVFEAIRRLPGCSEAICERQTEDGLFSMDIGVEMPSASSSQGSSVRLAIEVDGPHHFMSNKPRLATGETLLRNVLLEARGWRVVSVPLGPHAPWDGLRNAEERASYLQGLIDDSRRSASRVIRC